MEVCCREGKRPVVFNELLCSRMCVYCKLLRLERSGEQAGRKNGNCGPKYPFFLIPFLGPQIAHFGLAPSARLSLPD